MIQQPRKSRCGRRQIIVVDADQVLVAEEDHQRLTNICPGNSGLSRYVSRGPSSLSLRHIRSLH